MRRVIEQSRVSRRTRGAVLLCLLIAVALPSWTLSAAAAQRPRVNLGQRRLEKQRQQAERQAARPQTQPSAGDDGAPSATQPGAAGAQEFGPDRFTPEEISQLPRGLGGVQMRALIRVLRQLDLSAEQRQRLRELSRRYGNQLPVLARLLRAQNEALDEAIYGANFDPQNVERRAADVAATQGEIVKTRTRIMSELRQTLTAEQSARFRALLEQERLRIMQENRLGETGQPNQF
jgi:Spy/CpxP family protein refolding chaperone